MALVTISIRCPYQYSSCDGQCWNCEDAEVVSIVPNLTVEPQSHHHGVPKQSPVEPSSPSAEQNVQAGRETESVKVDSANCKDGVENLSGYGDENVRFVTISCQTNQHENCSSDGCKCECHDRSQTDEVSYDRRQPR